MKYEYRNTLIRLCQIYGNNESVKVKGDEMKKLMVG